MKMGQNPNRKDRLPFATHFHGLRLRVKILKYLLWIGRIFYQARTFGAFLKGFPKTNNVIFWTMSECEHFWWRWRGYINVYHSKSITALSNNPPESTEFYTSQSNTSNQYTPLKLANKRDREIRKWDLIYQLVLHWMNCQSNISIWANYTCPFGEVLKGNPDRLLNGTPYPPIHWTLLFLPALAMTVCPQKRFIMKTTHLFIYSLCNGIQKLA